MGNETTKERLTSMLKTGIFYMKDPQNIKEILTESFQDSSTLNSSKNLTTSISDSFSLRTTLLVNNSFMTIDFNLKDDLIIKFDKDIFKFSYFYLNNNIIVTLTDFIRKGINYAEKIMFKNEKINLNNMICKNGITLIYLDKSNNTPNNIYPIYSAPEKIVKEYKMKKFNNFSDFKVFKPEKVFLGSPIFYELNEGKIYIIGIVSKIKNNTKSKLNFSDIEIRFFTNDDINNLINIEYLFSNEKIQFKKHVKLNNIKRLNLSYEDINDSEFKLVLQYIQYVEDLNLSHLSIDSFPIKIFAQNKMKNLKILNLSSNQLVNIPFLAFANFPNLKELYLDNNGITNEGFKKFSQICSWSMNIKVLSLNNNHNIRDWGMTGFNFLNLEKFYAKNIGITNITVIFLMNNLKSLIELDVRNNFLTKNIKNEIDEYKIKQLSINYIGDHQRFTDYKSQTLKNNNMNNNLIASAQIFKNIRNDYIIRPYEKQIKLNINKEKNNINYTNSLNNILSDESLLSEEYLYQKYCVNSLYVSFPDKSNEIFTSFVISSNALLTLSNNIYNEKKGGQVIQIISSYSKQIMNPFIIFKKGKIAIITFMKNYFREWFGVANYDLLINNEKNENKDNLNILNFYASIDYNEEKCISEIHSIKINKNDDNLFSTENKNSLTKCFGGPITIKKNEEIYSIGILNNDYKPYYFSKEDIQFILYNIYLIKLSNNIFNAYDIETKLITLELPQKEISNPEFIKLLSLDLVNLEKIDVSENYIDERGCIGFSFGQFKKLKSLNMNKNFIGNSGFKILCENLNENIEIFKVSENNITSQGMDYLEKANFIKNISEIDISKNNIENYGIFTISKIKFPKLRYLNISKTKVNQNCLHYLNGMIDNNNTMRNLIVKENDISKNEEIMKILCDKIENIILE